MSKLKSQTLNKDQIKAHWLNFKKTNVLIYNEELLLSGLKFFILSLLFRKILVQNDSKNTDQVNIDNHADLMIAFNDVFCLANYQIKYKDRTFTLSGLDTKNTAEQEIITLTTENLHVIWDYMSELDFTNDNTICEFYSLYANILSISESLNKSRGIFYTPMVIAKKMAQEAITKFSMKKNLEEIIVLDSSCGIGNFLVSSFDIILDTLKISRTTQGYSDESVYEILRNQLIGYDTDDFAIIICKLRLLQKLLATTSSLEVTIPRLKNLFKNIKPNDFLTINMNKNVINPTIILGNPPWGQIENSTYRKEMLEGFDYLKGQVDAYRLFLERFIRLEPDLLSVLTPDSWLEIPGAKLLKNKFFENYYFTSLFILPKEIFPISTHFFGFVAEKTNRLDITEIEVSVIKYKIQDYSFVTKQKSILLEEMLSSSFLKNVVLENNFKELPKGILKSKDVIKLGSIIDVSIGYQLYHNSMHTPEEITNKVYHSNVKKGTDWVPQITSKNLHRFYIDFNSNSYVKRTAQFFRIPAEKFITSNKLLLREILAKDGLVVAKTDRAILFPKTVLSVILQENNTDKRLLQLLGYFMSYICQFDLLINGVKSSRDLFPRISLQSLKNLHINQKIFGTTVDELVQSIIQETEKKDIDSGLVLNEKFVMLQAKIFLVWEFTTTQATLIMDYLHIPIDAQNKVLKKM